MANIDHALRPPKPEAGLPGWLPYVVAAALFILGLYALSRLLHEVHLREVVAQIRDTAPSTLGLALAATAAGYLCLAGYDWSALRHIGKRLPGPVVLTGGLMAYAFGNTIGLTAFSGGAVRWRLYSGLGLNGYDIAAISAFTAIAFGTMNTLIGLASLAVHPTALAEVLPFDAASVRLLALVLLAAIVLPILWASASGRSVRLGRHTLRAPRPAILGTQMLIGLGDFTFAALTLYILLPPIDISFPGFLAIFAAAVMAGVISHVPGGVGVFEMVIIAAMPDAAEPGRIAAALLLYRLVYYLVPFTLSLLFLSLHAAWHASRRTTISLPPSGITQAVEAVLRALEPLAPLVLSITTFGAGLWMAVSALLPPMTRAEAALFPLAFLEGSALLSSALGSTLIVLSLGVLRRSLAAFWLVLGAMAAGALLTLAQQHGAQALILMLVIALLLPFRRAFSRRALLTHAVMTPAWLMLVVAALAGLGFTLFFAHKSTPYDNDLWWQYATDAQAPRALRAGLVAGLTLGLSGLFILLRTPRLQFGPPDTSTLATVADIVAAGDDPDAGFAMTGDKSIFLDEAQRAFVMFGVSGRSWIALGGPVGPRDAAQEVAFDFVDAARRADADPVFYEVGVRDVPTMLELGMSLHKMGWEAIVDLRRYTLEGPQRKHLRAVYSRAQRDGLTLDMTPPPHAPALIAELRIISDQWLAAGKAQEKGFSVGRFSAEWLDRWPLALVRHQGTIVAFANLMTTRMRQRATIDLMRHSDTAPPRTMDFLFIALMLALKEQGYAEFSLGMAPLSGLTPQRSRRLWDRFGALIYRRGGRFYNFSGLRAFKEKFDPTWHPRYLATTSARLPLTQLADSARLIARKEVHRDRRTSRVHAKKEKPA
ncbi:bifunctional lysylphosphatidylglycerol flippase/synthetase MprF [Parapusillimonas sp. SGNA-6]|nr:bifunctional lysylphosphatidylglycerol flippase/synthetase MprF [Parapusillimonas sp. SGNA-6]